MVRRGIGKVLKARNIRIDSPLETAAVVSHGATLLAQTGVVRRGKPALAGLVGDVVVRLAAGLDVVRASNLGTDVMAAWADVEVCSVSVRPSAGGCGRHLYLAPIGVCHSDRGHRISCTSSRRLRR